MYKLANKMNHILAKQLGSLILMFTLAASSHANQQQLTKNTQLVGEATLTKLFWKIYDSRLYTRNGIYQGIEPGMVLEITYQRAITSKQLIKSTRDEWRALSLYRERPNEEWLSQLKKMWPNVSKGDVITLKVGAKFKSHFYFNNVSIGTIKSTDFTYQFLAIWLSPKSNYPKLQQKLTGKI